MKNRTKKLISLVLVISLLFSFGSMIASASSDAPGSVERATSVPTVYIQGYGNYIYADKYDNTSEVLVGGEVPFLTDGVLGGMLENIAEPLMKGITTGDYTDYIELVSTTLIDDLGRFGLDENGEASDGSGNVIERDHWVTNRNYYDGKYDLYSYSLKYDWRVDPFLTASELNDYIQQVKAATGSSKVNLVGRCLGANIVLAYLSEYGYKDVNAVDFYVGGLDGFEIVGALFSGEVVVDADVLESFLQMTLENDEDDLISFLKSFIAILNAIKGLNLPIEIVYSIYDKVYEEILPRVLRESFGSMPAFWSFVGEDYFDAAIKLNFPTEEEQTKYAKLIEKITRYHNEVTLRTDEIINGAVDAGVGVYFTAKYGFAAMPLSKEANLNNDTTVSVTSQTYGATSADFGKTFSKDYLNNAEKNGTAKYISPDKCIDASTALLPDNTWFVKGSKHAYMPNCIDIMIAQIFEATYQQGKHITVNDLEAYPQYLYVDTLDEYAPLNIMTEEYTGSDGSSAVSIFYHITNFFEKLMKILKSFLTQLRGVVTA